MKTRSTALVIAAAAMLFAPFANAEYHYSQVVGKRYFRAPIDTYSVSIVRIDGKNAALRPALIEPGPHMIEVQGPPGGRGGIGEVRSFALDVAACTRYYLVAQKANTLAIDFKVQVDFQEPVAGCTPPGAS